MSVAIGLHIAMTLFLGVWIQDSPFRILLGPFMLAESAQHASMFDVMAIASYLGAASIAWPAAIGIALFLIGAICVARSEYEIIALLSLLSILALLWSYHWHYDYLVLIVPLSYAVKRWNDGTIGLADFQIAAAAIIIWFVQRAFDSAVLRFPGEPIIMILDRGVFWLTCLLLYTSLAIYIVRLKPKRLTEST
jgi:hypothetical protein